MDDNTLYHIGGGHYIKRVSGFDAFFDADGQLVGVATVAIPDDDTIPTHEEMTTIAAEAERRWHEDVARDTINPLPGRDKVVAENRRRFFGG